jgi:general secretion pathway protein D
VTRLLSISCFLLILGRAGVAQEPVVQTPAGVQLDFQNVELRLVVAALAEAAGLSVVYGELPPQNVTVRTGEPIPLDAVSALLRSVVEANGLLMIEEAGVVRIERDPAFIGNGAPPAPEQANPPQGPRGLYVYRLLHARAPHIAQTIGSLFGIGGGGAIAAARPAAREARAPAIPPFELPADAQAAGAANLTQALPGEVSGDIQIVADELTNSLLVRASPEDWSVVLQAVQALDLRPLQVLIEVVILEVRRDREHEVGLSLGRIDSLSAPISDRVDAVLRGTGGGDFTITARDLGGLGVDASLSLLAASGNVRILSRPVVLAQNNQQARILVGSERPFVQVFRSLPTESAIRDQIVQYRDVGTSLTITPTINPDGYVNLDVLQEVSSATAETQLGAPVISTREAATRLFVRSGQSVVIGGLIEEQRDWSRSGIPFLKDIPLLGYLFGSTRSRTIRSELFLFLTPHIVATDADVDRVNQAIHGGSRMLPDPPPPLVPRSEADPQGEPEQ